ncbi:MAG: Hsp20/alpha crystallin family protein [Myxococcota bacterium]|nr:Hsp20/alpha crystallin family protein [Myxococcota bacterium]
MTDREATQELTASEKQPVAGEGTRPGPVYRPDVDILESRDGYLIHVDLPGVDEKALDVRLEDGVLRLDVPAPAPDGAVTTPLHTEYRPGGYHREFRISEGIDAAAVTAELRNGVLELRLPKSEARKPRSIEVRAA